MGDPMMSPDFGPVDMRHARFDGARLYTAPRPVDLDDLSGSSFQPTVEGSETVQTALCIRCLLFPLYVRFWAREIGSVPAHIAATIIISVHFGVTLSFLSQFLAAQPDEAQELPVVVVMAPWVGLLLLATLWSRGNAPRYYFHTKHGKTRLRLVHIRRAARKDAGGALRPLLESRVPASDLAEQPAGAFQPAAMDELLDSDSDNESIFPDGELLRQSSMESQRLLVQTAGQAGARASMIGSMAAQQREAIAKIVAQQHRSESGEMSGGRSMLGGGRGARASTASDLDADGEEELGEEEEIEGGAGAGSRAVTSEGPSSDVGDSDTGSESGEMGPGGDGRGGAGGGSQGGEGEVDLSLEDTGVIGLPTTRASAFSGIGDDDDDTTEAGSSEALADVDEDSAIAFDDDDDEEEEVAVAERLEREAAAIIEARERAKRRSLGVEGVLGERGEEMSGKYPEDISAELSPVAASVRRRSAGHAQHQREHPPEGDVRRSDTGRAGSRPRQGRASMARTRRQASSRSHESQSGAGGDAGGTGADSRSQGTSPYRRGTRRSLRRSTRFRDVDVGDGAKSAAASSRSHNHGDAAEDTAEPPQSRRARRAPSRGRAVKAQSRTSDSADEPSKGILKLPPTLGHTSRRESSGAGAGSAKAPFKLNNPIGGPIKDGLKDPLEAELPLRAQEEVRMAALARSAMQGEHHHNQSQLQRNCSNRALALTPGVHAAGARESLRATPSHGGGIRANSMAVTAAEARHFSSSDTIFMSVWSRSHGMRVKRRFSLAQAARAVNKRVLKKQRAQTSSLWSVSTFLFVVVGIACVPLATMYAHACPRNAVASSYGMSIAERAPQWIVATPSPRAGSPVPNASTSSSLNSATHAGGAGAHHQGLGGQGRQPAGLDGLEIMMASRLFFLATGSLWCAALSAWEFAWAEPWLALCITSGTLATLIVNSAVMVLLLQVESAYQIRLLTAESFASLTSFRRAKQEGVPHFRLHKMPHVLMWLNLRGLLRKRGTRRDVDLVAQTLFVLTMVLVVAMLVADMQGASSGSSSVSVGAGAEGESLGPAQLIMLLWAVVSFYFSLRFMGIGKSVASKNQATAQLQIEQINLYLRMLRRPEKKEELASANAVLKLATSLLKDMDKPAKDGGIGLDSSAYNAVRLVILSALSYQLTRLFGLKLQLHRIKE